ncbi:hypothetical protein Tco_0266821 [Tanacetum coccineum]
MQGPHHCYLSLYLHHPLTARADISRDCTRPGASKETTNLLLPEPRDGQHEGQLPGAEIEVLRRERLAYEQESMETRQALARSEAYCRALKARVTVLETEKILTELYFLKWKKMAPKRATRSTPVTPTLNATTTTTVTEAQLQALINPGVAALQMAEAEANKLGIGIWPECSGPKAQHKLFANALTRNS